MYRQRFKHVNMRKDLVDIQRRMPAAQPRTPWGIGCPQWPLSADRLKTALGTAPILNRIAYAMKAVLESRITPQKVHANESVQELNRYVIAHEETVVSNY